MAGNFKTDISARGFLHCGDEDRAARNVMTRSRATVFSDVGV
jgi:hypothetical protein